VTRPRTTADQRAGKSPTGAKAHKSVARQRAEQARLARERAARRSRRVRTAWFAIAAAPMTVALLVLIKVAIPDSTGAPTGPRELSAAVLAALDPHPSTLDLVGRGQVDALPQRIDAQPALTEGGKPLVLYIGGEYCPFCASQRWALVTALNRFGEFTGLTGTRSAETNTATVSFHGATYTSPYLAFQGVELATNRRQGNFYEPLDRLTAAQEQIMRTYDAPPYVPERSTGAVPFVDFANRFLQTGSAFSPLLLGELSQDQIAAELTNDPTGEIGRALYGSANAFTVILCVLTEGQPADVCASPAATAYQQEVGGA
jgi:hypothetical protein